MIKLASLILFMLIQRRLGQETGSGVGLNTTNTYQNHADLIPNVYRVYWNASNTSPEFNAEVHCKTTGWVGFG